MQEIGGIDEMMEQKEDTGLKAQGEKTEPVKKRRPFHYWSVNGKEYKLKLTTTMISMLENKYRTNILNLVSDSGIPPLSVMLTIIQAAMAPWEHGKTYAVVQNMYDTWSEQGGNQMDFFTGILMPTMAVSGFFTEKQAESLMKEMKNMDELL